MLYLVLVQHPFEVRGSLLHGNWSRSLGHLEISVLRSNGLVCIEFGSAQNGPLRHVVAEAQLV